MKSENILSQPYSKQVDLRYNTLPKWIQNSNLCQNQIDTFSLAVCGKTDQSSIDNKVDICKDDLVILSAIEYSNFNTKIESHEDILRLLRVIQYWDVNIHDYPYEILDYILINNPSCIQTIIQENYSQSIDIQTQLPVLLYFKGICNYVKKYIDSVDIKSNDNSSTDINNIFDYIYNQFKRKYDEYIQDKDIGNVSIAKTNKFNYNSILECSVINNDIYLLTYTLEYRQLSLRKDVKSDVSKILSILACRYNNSHMLKSLLSHGCCVSASCMRWALRNNTTVLIDTLADNKCPWVQATDEEERTFIRCIYNRFESFHLITSLLDRTNIDVDIKDEVNVLLISADKLIDVCIAH